MQPNEDYLGKPLGFWADVRSISQGVGYTERRTKSIRIPQLGEIERAYKKIGLRAQHIGSSATGSLTPYGEELLGYFSYRAEVLNDHVQNVLMDADEARRRMYELLHAEGISPVESSLVQNKQRGDKAGPALLTNVVNILVNKALEAEGMSFDRDPRALTSFTRGRRPVRTLSRRVDGALPAVADPVAVWEIKEYYHTTTFGSRVADGVYETLLDGLELQEARENAGAECLHYLFVDSHYTWWESGRSYLCRLVDIMHMGLVTEVVFGREVYDRVPSLAAEWVKLLKSRRT